MRRAVLVGLAVMICATSAAQASCRQALALGLDVSASVDAAEYRLQRHGLAHALLSPQVVAAFETLPSAPVSLMIYEWSGYTSQRVVLPWTTIRSRADLSRAADLLQDTTGPRSQNATAIGGAALFAARQFDQVKHCWRKTLDLSGDGKNNDGPTPLMLTNDPRMKGVTINGLVIATDTAAASTPRSGRQSTVPLGNATVPPDQTTAPPGPTTVPPDQITVPPGQTAVPTDQATGPQLQTTGPQLQTTAPHDRTTGPPDQTTSPPETAPPPGSATQRAGTAPLVGYFQRHVIRGPGAFTEVALGFAGFEAAMRRKLLREIRVPQFSELARGSK